MFGGLIKSVGKSLVKQGLDIVNETLDKTLNQGGGGADANSGLQSSIPIPGLSSALESFGGGAAGFGFGGLLGGLIQNVIASSGGGEGGEGGLLDSLTKLVVEKAGPTVLPPSFNYNRGKVDVCYLGHTHKACPVMLIDPPSAGDLRVWIDEHARPIPGKSKSSPQDYEKIKEDCLAEGKLFEDPSFPAEDCSLFYSKRPFRRFRWLRPHEICSDPQFVVDDASRFDIQQGELGDCWLLAAMANLTINPVLFKRIVPDDQSFDDGEYAGIFHFRFWQYGQWVDVVIDDKLPTYNGKLVYLQSQEKNEFWSALLEKAYAKLHGSYEALKGGTTSEAMEDFTGGVAEMYELNNADMSLFKIMVKSFERSSLMSCAIEPDPNVVEAETAVGLIKGHAYSITDVRLISIQTPRVSGKIPMVRIRNPWGNEAEWNGAWSDKSPEWQYIPDEEKESIGLTFNTDGEFWMSFKDYKKYFSRMEIVHLSPEIYDEVVEDEECKKKWELNSFEGAWVRGATAGGCRNNLQTFWTNPQFRMTLEDCDEDEDDKCTLIVSLMQKNRRSQRKAGLDLLTIGFAIYAINDPDNAPKPLDVRFFKYNASVARSPAFINLREVCARFKLPPGTYCLVPSTFDRGEEGEFIIRVFTEKSNSMQENDAELGYDDSGEQMPEDDGDEDDGELSINSSVRDVFKQISGEDSEVDWQELQQALDIVMKQEFDFEGFSKDTCRSMIAMLDVDHSGRLGYEEFRKLWSNIVTLKGIFKEYDADESGTLSTMELRSALAAAGYRVNFKILNALVLRYGNKQGSLSFDDYLMCAIKLKNMIELYQQKDPMNTRRATFTLDEWVEKTLYS
ncbi:calpain-B-like isoform X7 [Artemia franciscana]|uniref:calpain-B-like isoform X7 n=1 Tax=Artemia franciscana TaxID=6661 RepID=UPI0032DB2115